MKKIVITIMAALTVAFLPAAASAEQVGPYEVDQLNSDSCEMSLVAPNGAFMMAIDTSSNVTIVATRPYAKIENNADVDVVLSFDGDDVSLIGIGMSNNDDGGVIVSLGKGDDFIAVLDETKLLTISAKGSELISILIDNDFRQAANATIQCTSALQK